MTSKALLENIGKGVYSIIANQLADHKIDEIEFLWKSFQYQGE